MQENQPKLLQLKGIARSKEQQKLPVVLARDEVRELFRKLESPYRILTGLMYGSGLHLMEALRLRVKDLDFTYRAIIIQKPQSTHW